MSLLKIPLLILDGVCMHLCATPPNRPTPSDEHLIPDWRERFLKSLGRPCVYLRSLYYTTLLFEVLTILVHHNPTALEAQPQFHVTLDDSCPARLDFTPAFIFGMSLVLSGTLLRLGSFKTLGRFFTFELYLFNDHELVITGPYSLVRHPSYTGLILTVLGICCNRLMGSWVWECGFLQTVVGKLMATTWFLIAMSVIASLVLRVPREEAILRDQFKKEWEAWAERVPYKLIPGVY